MSLARGGRHFYFFAMGGAGGLGWMAGLVLGCSGLSDETRVAGVLGDVDSGGANRRGTPANADESDGAATEAVGSMGSRPEASGGIGGLAASPVRTERLANDLPLEVDTALALDLAACRELDGRARQCGVLVEGSLCPAVPTDVDGCRAGCLRLAACDLLSAGLCDVSSLTSTVADGGLDPESLLRACLAACAFSCDDDVVIVARWRCDGTPQCVDGSDELDCPSRSFTCPDDALVPISWVCDGQNDCAGAADESTCNVTARVTCE